MTHYLVLMWETQYKPNGGFTTAKPHKNLLWNYYAKPTENPTKKWFNHIRPFNNPLLKLMMANPAETQPRALYGLPIIKF